MSFNSSLADLVSSINNSGPHSQYSFKVKKSNLILHILDVLQNLGYIKPFKSNDLDLQLYLNLVSGVKSVSEIQLVSKPSKRVYMSYNDIQQCLKSHPFRTFIISTSKGIMSSKDAILTKIGGEVLFFVS